MLEKSKSLDLEARKVIYDCIIDSPGIHFRELQRRTGMATGSMEYHLHFLHKNSMIRIDKSARFARYYPTDKAFDEEEKKLLGLLRQEKVRHILIYIIDSNSPSASEISQHTGIPPSSLSWYLNMLLEKGVLNQKKKGRFRFYSVNDKKRIITCLIAHKKSFLDELVDSFIEAWEYN